MNNLSIRLLGYFSSWVLMLVTLAVALFAEAIHTFLSGKTLNRRGMIVSFIPLRDIFRSITAPINLPENAAVRLSYTTLPALRTDPCCGNI